MITFDDLTRSQTLRQHIHDEIAHSSDQCISFARFMELALFTPSLGYYQARSNLLGNEGDFTTAPEISSRLARCLARYCEPILRALPSDTSVLMEVGPGTGRLAADLLLMLEKLGCLPRRYLLVEVSEGLRKQQIVNLRNWVPHLMDRVEQCAELPSTPIQGIILANEVIDALPVHRFHLSQDALYEYYVQPHQGQLRWHLDIASTDELHDQLQQIRRDHLQGVSWYSSEVRLSLKSWFTALQACLSQGYMILIDYGRSEREYYHRERLEGTLRCYFQHRCYNNPLMRVGLQDITSDVDFTQVATLAQQAGLDLIAFVSQAAFLVVTGLVASDELYYNAGSYLEVKGQIHQLMSPSEMGELCKVMILGRGLPCNLLSLEAYDRCRSL